MKLETILQILYSNNLTDVITRAIQIDNNIISNDKPVGQFVIVEVTTDELTRMGLKRKNGGEYWTKVALKIEAYNQYALKEKYLVCIGNQSRWVEDTNGCPSEVEFIDAPDHNAI